MNKYYTNKELEIIISIQRHIKIKLLKRELKKLSFNKLDIIFSQLDYNQTIIKLMDKKLTKIVYDVLFKINRILNPNDKKMSKLIPKLFMSMYLIKYQYEDVFTYVSKKERKNLQLLAIRIIDFMKNSFKLYDLYKFGSLFNFYCTEYNIIQKIDKIELLKLAYRQYYDLTLTKKFVLESTKYPDEQKNKVIGELDKQMKESFYNIRMLDKTFTLDKLENIIKTEENIKSSIKQSYWDNFELKLKNNNYEDLKILLNKVKTILIDLHPSKSNKKYKILSKTEIKKDFNEYLDVEYIIHKLENNVMTSDDIIGVCSYVLEIVKTLESPIRNSETDNIWNKLLSSNKQYYEFIPEFFKNLFVIIDQLCSDILLLFSTILFLFNFIVGVINPFSIDNSSLIITYF
jgi:hypothetical protein